MDAWRGVDARGGLGASGLRVRRGGMATTVRGAGGGGVGSDRSGIVLGLGTEKVLRVRWQREVAALVERNDEDSRLRLARRWRD